MVNLLLKIFGLITAAALVACGGGGGNTGAPKVEVVLSKSKVHVGETVALTWSSTGSVSCFIQGLSNSTNETMGSISFEPLRGGRFTYAVQCKGVDGTSAKKEVSLVVPMPVYATSYENKNQIEIDESVVGMLFDNRIEKTEVGINMVSTAFADFFQDGTFSAFGASINIKELYQGVPVADSHGYAYFFKKGSDGQWFDASAQLFKSLADRKTCVSSNYTLVADFNEDKKPDIFVTCTGIDWPMPDEQSATEEAWKAWNYSPQILFLSQADGTYQRKELPTLYGHQASAGDINRDGHIDVVVLTEPPQVWLGNGDGTFRITSQLRADGWALRPGQTYAVNLIPIDGRLDLVAADAVETHWTKGRSAGGFDFTTTRVFPNVISSVTQLNYQFPLDVLYINGYFYLNTATNAAGITDWAILKCNSSSLACGVHYQYTVTHGGVWPVVPVPVSVLIQSDKGRRIRPMGLIVPTAPIQPDQNGKVSVEITP